jgi:hypothetical protein
MFILLIVFGLEFLEILILLKNKNKSFLALK